MQRFTHSAYDFRPVKSLREDFDFNSDCCFRLLWCVEKRMMIPINSAQNFLISGINMNTFFLSHAPRPCSYTEK